MGCATGTYPYYRMPGMAARITLDRDGHATVASAAHEMGMGTATVQRQHAAERLGLPLDKVTVRIGDTSLPVGSWPAARRRPPRSARRSSRRSSSWRANCCGSPATTRRSPA